MACSRAPRARPQTAPGCSGCRTPPGRAAAAPRQSARGSAARRGTCGARARKQAARASRAARTARDAVPVEGCGGGIVGAARQRDETQFAEVRGVGERRAAAPVRVAACVAAVERESRGRARKEAAAAVRSLARAALPSGGRGRRGRGSAAQRSTSRNRCRGSLTLRDRAVQHRPLHRPLTPRAPRLPASVAQAACNTRPPSFLPSRQKHLVPLPQHLVPLPHLPPST